MVTSIPSEEYEVDEQIMNDLLTTADELESFLSEWFDADDLDIQVHGNCGGHGYYIDCYLLDTDNYDISFYDIEDELGEFESNCDYGLYYEGRHNIFLK